MIIRNKKTFSQSTLRAQALHILEAGLASIRIPAVLKKQVSYRGNILRIQNEYIDLSRFKRIGVIGIGKCALETGAYVEHLLGKRIFGGAILDVASRKFTYMHSIAGTHPLPSEENKRATLRIVQFAKSLNPETDLLIFAVSGGGSSLFFDTDGISVPNMIRLTHDLHTSGATIHELNCVRKHLSGVQGGKFAKMIYPLPTLALYFSDAVSKTSGVNLRTIASGPLYPDNKTNADARRILEKYELWQSYKKHISHWNETVKEKKYFSHVRNFLLLTNQTMLDAMFDEAQKLKLRPKILTNTFIARSNAAFRKMKALAARFPNHDAYLAAGETTVRVHGKGMGGRNQEAVLAALTRVKKNELFVSIASDGRDNTEFAGALADEIAQKRALSMHVDVKEYLAQNDSFHFFKKTGDYIKTGPTGSNVSDAMLYLKKKR